MSFTKTFRLHLCHIYIINTNTVIQRLIDLGSECFYLEITEEIHGLWCHQRSGTENWDPWESQMFIGCLYRFSLSVRRSVAGWLSLSEDPDAYCMITKTTLWLKILYSIKIYLPGVLRMLLVITNYRAVLENEILRKQITGHKWQMSELCHQWILRRTFDSTSVYIIPDIF